MNHIALSTDPEDGIQSVLFPLQVAKDVMSNLTSFSMDTLEAHGPGMELKFFEFANTLADVMICVPQSHRNVQLAPQDFLVHVASMMGTFRGGNSTLLPILQNRLTRVGLGIPAVPRISELANESTESDRAGSMMDSDQVVGGSAEECRSSTCTTLSRSKSCRPILYGTCGIS